MLRLEFNTFQKKIHEDRLVNHISTVHCMVNDTGFVFVMKSMEKWEYYATMAFETIRAYALDNEIDPVDALDMFVANYCKNTLQILPPDVVVELNEEVETPVDEFSEDIFKHPTFTSLKEVDPGDDIVEQAEDYSDFLLKFFDNMEKSVLRATKKLNKTYTQKTLGEFLRDLFNSVNTAVFADQVRRFIKADMIKGLVSSEEELGVQIGFTDSFQVKLDILAEQQIDGYTINGRKWPGIRGVTKEIQASVTRIVQDGIQNESDLDTIRDEIKLRFDNFSEWRAEMIARTETTRITNEGKILGYKESGMKGEKVWSAAQPRGCKGCSKICDRMDGQAVPLDAFFVDPGTNRRYEAPPGHPNCRSTIFFRPDDISV